MARILITGSAQGLGRSAATNLIDQGHQVVVHTRDPQRVAALTQLVHRGTAVVVGDLASDEQTRRLADQVNDLGRMDAIIHNAGAYGDTHRDPSPEGHSRLLAVNTLAPYLLTGLIERPNRLIYLTSDMHLSGDDNCGTSIGPPVGGTAPRHTATASCSSPPSPSPSPAAGPQ